MPGDRKHQFADAFRRQRIGGNTFRRCINRLTGCECAVQGRRPLRFDGDDLHPASEPCGYAADQPSATHCHKQRRYTWKIGLDLSAECPLAEQRFRLVKGMYGESAALFGEFSLAASASA